MKYVEIRWSRCHSAGMVHGEGVGGSAQAIEELERELGDVLTSISQKLERGEESESQYKQWLGTLAGLCQHWQ